jgi:hypothetical protein
MKYRLQRQSEREENPVKVTEIGKEPPLNVTGFWRKPDPHVIEDTTKARRGK